ncbi:MAG: chitobiase/beta-hexosaminidase C-terminal domain-containing protein [Saprospiraceae bacterium]|nr:chitobiase/beta-hexosaminidase C-terminal domain-containing protein [Saprospiraceae bacterium]MCB9320615.1 chitobiase/beta-hexosaminidase C-terminal domain-containing protein [Lewinellaceae bacterium]
MRVRNINSFASLMLFISVLVMQYKPASGQVRLPAILSDHMVMQANRMVSLWGWCNAGEKVTIRPGWTDSVFVAEGTNMAKWQVRIPTPQASAKTYSIRIEASNQLEIKDVMIGEVWLCSGQSNMEWSMRSGIDDREKLQKQADVPEIRLFQVPRTTADYPQDDLPGKWVVCDPSTVETFSAVGYFFGKQLHDKLLVPVGLINSSWGGTPAEVWTPADVINKDSEFSSTLNLLSDSRWWPRAPGVLYNAMIYPLATFPIQGVIWYQGESNTANPLVYRRLFPAMIESWRQLWKAPISFYFVQIAPYNYGTPLVGAMVREAQLLTLRLPHTGMTVVSDIGNLYDIHPRNKLDVGTRLANIALAKDYGRTDLEYSGPLFLGDDIQGSRMRIRFDHAKGLKTTGGPVTDLEMAGPDRIFHPATGKIENNQLVVTSDAVSDPVAVRYAFSNLGVGNLVNEAGLPASSFRTDDWPVILDAVEIQQENGQITMTCANAGAEIYYTLNGEDPMLSGKRYTETLNPTSSVSILARAKTPQGWSSNSTLFEWVNNLATNHPVSLYTPYAREFSGGGVNALTNGKKGSINPADGNWQGYKGDDLDAVIDLGEERDISKIKTQFLELQNTLIFPPSRVEFAVSKNGKKYKTIHTWNYSVNASNAPRIIEVAKFINTSARYIRIQAKNIGNCPSWHVGAGQPAWLFVDEVEVE